MNFGFAIDRALALLDREDPLSDGEFGAETRVGGNSDHLPQQGKCQSDATMARHGATPGNSLARSLRQHSQPSPENQTWPPSVGMYAKHHDTRWIGIY